MFELLDGYAAFIYARNLPAKSQIKSSKQMRIQSALLLLAISADEILCAGGMHGARDILAFALGR